MALTLRIAKGSRLTHEEMDNNLTYLQGLAQERIKTIDIVDVLTATDTDKPLSANQGKVLKDSIDTKADVANTTLTLQTFDDDAAAGTGGLTTGMIYITTTGEVRSKL